ncbi:XdhC family protein [Enterococcus termitis]|uniref:Xanthine dehydrogenase accessory factor n=1 Tax=Enterococcus termitis TaxID=332950 RepID=A0A1E5GI74_9ENTE|nr:XdhC/CoxI family protein [Enterococcus termitis]OEG12377.1 xanthine dehydrogenase accessory factor [Enterococcus termitis]
MREIFEQLAKAINQQQDTVLVTVISSSGSTPRSEGARMLISDSGRIAGTIGGGAVEFRAEQLAKEVLKTRTAIQETFILAPNDVADLGMICGGNVEVLFQFLSYQEPSNLEICNLFQEYNAKNQQCWLISEIGEKPSNRISLYDKASILSSSDLQGLKEADIKQGISIVSSEGGTFLVESLLQTGKVYIFGGGHVAQALVPVLKRLAFYCVVLDDRAELLTAEYFPDADQSIVVDLKHIEETIHVTADDYMVIMTRGHQFDFEVTRQLLPMKPYYIGVMGSKHKIAVQIKRLKESGFEASEIERINMPIGLKIKAETPAELAISVAGELIIKRSEK